MSLTFGSLFAGIGGFDLGFERAGLECKWQVEIEPFCQRVLAKHWPGVRRHGDIRTLVPDETWSVDVICGGFPCKQTSTAAAISDKRVGLEGADSGLWYEMLRVVRLVRPQWVVVENVAGARTWQKTIEAGLEDAGFCIPWEPLRLSAESFGAPHRRWRLFWIAYRDESGLEGTWPSGPSAPERKSRRGADGNAWLQSLPRTLRVADGVSSRLDRRSRINAIGNAVVPAVAEHIGHWLNQHVSESDTKCITA